jgi:TPR repeat protein
MRCGSSGKAPLRALFFVVASIYACAAHDAAAATRHALIVGIGDYNEKNGLPKLLAPRNDAEQIKSTLEKRGFDFVTDILVDQDVKDKAAFNERLQKFVSRIGANDEVLFYFSGHGFNVPDKGNFFLLPDAKGEDQFLQGSPAAGESHEEGTRRYQAWIADIAVSENALLAAIAAKRPRVILIVADACRSYLAGGKAAAPVTKGIVRPKQTPRGTFLFYSAREGQVSLDAPVKLLDPDANTSKQAGGKEGDKDKDKTKKVNSLFTSALLREIETPALEINILAAKVKTSVRNQARLLGRAQVPDFSDDVEATDFFFWQGESKLNVAARCRTAPAELAELGYGIAHGSVSNDDVESKRIELAPCGYAGEIDKLLRLQEQGAGQQSTKYVASPAASLSDNPADLCDQLASSQLDANRQPGTGGYDVQKTALAAISGGNLEQATVAVDRAIDTCTKAVTERSRVGRFKYNLGRAYYAKAAITTGDERRKQLVQATKNFQEAVNFGYAAAYNSVAALYQNNEYYVDESSTKNDREAARELLQRGADLGDALAQYNLGMAYKNGDLGLDVGHTLDEIQADAFQYLSKAAESGYVPAMIETAVALHNGYGIKSDTKRAIDLLEVSASRGSWEAMYVLGEIYDKGSGADDNEALIWYARAAEAGDSRSQAALARLMTDGKGLPAPQREAAARYWRLAADGGSLEAQVELANLLRDGKVPFRPNLASNGAPDGGAQEILQLYTTAFARGFPGAGLELARLYRTGFPRGTGSDAIPKNPERAVELLWKTMDRVRQAAPDSSDANPEFNFQAAFELIKMHGAAEDKRPDGTGLLLDDQIEQLRLDFGDPDKLIYIRVGAIGKIECPGHTDFWVAVWDRASAEPPTENQFDWFERFWRCKQRPADDKRKDERKNDRKDEDLGITKKIRSVFNREFSAWLKSKGQQSDNQKGKPPKTYTERMVELVNKNKRSR